MGLENERVVYNPLMVGSPSSIPTDGLGGGGLLTGIILAGLLGRNGLGGYGYGGGGYDGHSIPAVPGTTVLEQNVSELRKDVAGVNTTVEALGNELQGALSAQTAAQTSQFNHIGDLIMSGSKENALLAKDAIIVGMTNTQSIKDQATTFQAINQENFCTLKAAISADGDATRALINQTLIDGLREELARERRGRDQREIEINVTQTNQQTQAQLQAQMQQQNQFLATMFNSLGDQVNRAANSVVNVGSGTVAGGQTSNQSNTKVNS